MYVCMVLDDSFPPDIRVSKEAKSLARAGHEVLLLCKHDDGQPRRERVGPIDVVRLPLFKEYGDLTDLKNGSYYLGARINLPWMRAITEWYDSEVFDALHVHDLPLVKTALQWAEDREVSVVADLHENWPEAKRQYRKSKRLGDLLDDPQSTLDRLATPIWRLKGLERSSVRGADRVVAVVEEGKAHYVDDCGAVPEHVYVVPNYVDLEAFPGENDVEPVTYDADFSLLYVGTIGGEHRGLKTVIRAMPALAEVAADPQFVVVGDGPYVSELRQLARDLGVESLVNFVGWVDFEDLPPYIAGCDVGLVPHRNNPHTATTIPHKLTQYMALGKPVLVTDVPPLARIVTDADAGLVAPAGDPDEMATAAIDMYEHPERTAQFGENAERAVHETYNWETAGSAVCDLYDGLAERSPCKTVLPQ